MVSENPNSPSGDRGETYQSVVTKGATADLAESEFIKVSDTGSGRATIILFDDESFHTLVTATAESLREGRRILVVKIQAISGVNWEALHSALPLFLSDEKVRQASYICFGAAANLIQNLLLDEPKAVRTLVIVDAPSRPHPSTWDRLVDKVERFLPLGLPLRLGTAGFNVQAYLHRVRCPLLVVTTPQAGAFLQGDAEGVARSAPTAWRISLTDDELAQGLLSETIVQFQETPAKCPQKNVK